jgi:hypothetical protein
MGGGGDGRDTETRRPRRTGGSAWTPNTAAASVQMRGVVVTARCWRPAASNVNGSVAVRGVVRAWVVQIQRVRAAAGTRQRQHMRRKGGVLVVADDEEHEKPAAVPPPVAAPPPSWWLLKVRVDKTCNSTAGTRRIVQLRVVGDNSS